MSGVHSLIDEVEAAFRSGTADSRATVLRRITDLFLDGAHAFKEVHIGVFDDVLCGLVDKIEREAVAELSASMAAHIKAPPLLCRQLSAHDDIAIAGPMLVRSPLLSDSHLVDVAQRRSQLHLRAIAGRPQLSERVSDVLIERGDSAVLTTVAQNFGARISSRGYGTLVGKAASDDGLAAAVAARPDLTPEIFRKLVAQATATVQQRLLQTADAAMKDKLQGVLQGISMQVARNARPKVEVRDAPAATQLVDKVKLRADLIECAAAGRVAETAVALATLAVLSTDTIKGLMARPEPDALLIVCKACGLGWLPVRSILELAAGTRGHIEENAAVYMDKYNRLPREDAERVMRFLKVRKAASDNELRQMLAS